MLRGTMRARQLLAALLVSVPVLAATTVARALPAGSVTEFRFSSHEESEPRLIAPGPDGVLWFSVNGNKAAYHAIARISTDGVVLSELSEGLTSIPYDLTTGPDGALWFTGVAPDAIGRLVPGGSIGEFTAGLESHEPERIAPGPDGNLWFTVENAPLFNSLGWITPAGEITVIPPSELPAGSRPHGVAAGPEGNVWFTDGGSTAAIGRVTPCGAPHCVAKPEEFTKGLTVKGDPESIVPGPEGALWFTDDAAEGKIGRVTPCAGPCTPTIEEFPLGAGTSPYAIAVGADGTLWFTDGNTNSIGHVVPCTPVPGCTPAVGESAAGIFPGTEPVGIAPGPDGNVWFTARGAPEAIGRVGTGAPGALQSSPAVTGGARAGTPQTCAAAGWSTWAGEQPSPTLLPVDGFTWQLDGATVGAGQRYTPSPSQAGRTLTCSETVTYPLPLLVTPASAASAPAVVTVAPSPISPPAAAPRITRLRQSAARWREGRRLARISAARRPPVGTTFSLVLSEPATVRLVFARQAGGRLLAGRCVKPTHRNARHRSCALTAGTLALHAHAGTNRIVFQGRLSARRRLPLGSYRVSVTATGTSGLRSAPQQLRFTIVR